MKRSRLWKNSMMAASMFISIHIFAQTAGDEDRQMFNNAKQRDQLAVDEAVNGWWTASMKTHEQRVEWWREAKFGMFIHWGIYSLPGGEWKGKRVSGYAEHLMRKEQISRKEYLELAHRFNPVLFNADEWISNAKKAGMKYFIITAKHHDGFGMYTSAVSDFDLADQSPFRRDPMAELAAAAKRQGMKFGFYYSHAFDWEHPDAPGNDWELNNPGGDKLLGGANWYDTHPEWLPKAQKYVREKAIPQIKELIAKYHPDILWFDTPGKLPLSENIFILKAIREADPNIVVNGRLVRSAAANFGDYKNTADRPAEFYPVTGDWEAIPTTNESYGYSKFDSSHKPVGHFIQLLANAASRGGNLLMNIGPKGDGAFDQKDLAILKGIGAWMDKNGESIYGTTASSLPIQNWGVSTLKGNKLYLHVFKWPKNNKLVVGGLKSAFGTAWLLADATRKIPVKRLNINDIVLDLPANNNDAVNTVIVLELKGKIATATTRFIATAIAGDRLLAFDAVQQGKGFGFGDGKTNRFFVEGWKSMDQSLNWNFRTDGIAQYDIIVKYITSETAGGVCQLIVNDTIKYDLLVEPGKGTDAVVKKVGQLVTGGKAGMVFKIELKPLSITKTELMKLLEIDLVRQ